MENNKTPTPLIAEYNLEPCQNFQCTSNGLPLIIFQKEDINLKEKTAIFNDWYHNTDDWPIEETIPVSEEWPELVTESETD
ncbi:33926_t:CDS:2, partial [Gigaspora margarita]